MDKTKAQKKGVVDRSGRAKAEWLDQQDEVEAQIELALIRLQIADDSIQGASSDISKVASFLRSLRRPKSHTGTSPEWSRGQAPSQREFVAARERERARLDSSTSSRGKPPRPTGKQR